MRVSIKKACCLFVLFLLPCSLVSQATTAQKALSPREFVEGFYKWYISRNPGNVSWDFALKYRSSAFSPQLLRLLKANSAAQAACEDIVGLDFDPILNTQDPDNRYEVGNIAQTGQNYKAEIYGVRSGKRDEKPYVIAEFTEDNGHWYFVNFHYLYDDGTIADLLTILKNPEKCMSPRSPSKK